VVFVSSGARDRGGRAATQSLGNLAASAIAGILWAAASPTAAFLVLAAAIVVSLALARLEVE
jgi:hypothetical protein